MFQILQQSQLVKHESVTAPNVVTITNTSPMAISSGPHIPNQNTLLTTKYPVHVIINHDFLSNNMIFFVIHT